MQLTMFNARETHFPKDAREDRVAVIFVSDAMTLQAWACLRAASKHHIAASEV